MRMKQVTRQKALRIEPDRTSMEVQGLRLCLPVQEV